MSIQKPSVDGLSSSVPSSPERAEQMTAVFNCNLRKFPTNPHLAETPFGKAQIVGIGNAFNEHDAVCDALLELTEALKRIADIANHGVNHADEALAQVDAIARDALSSASGSTGK